MFAGLAARTDDVPPWVALVVAVLAVSTSAPLVRLSEAPSTVKAFYRVAFMTAIVAPLALRRGSGDFRRIGRRDLGVAIVSGVALAAHFAFWFVSLDLTTIAASATLVQTQPLFVALGGWALLDERVTTKTAVGILVAVVGASLMGLDAASSTTASAPLLGNLLAVLAAAMASGYVLAGRSLRQRIRVFPYVTVVYAACTAVLFGVVLAQGHDLLAYPPREWVLFLAMAVGPGIFGHTVVNWVLERVESWVVSVSLLGEPVGSALLALALFAEVPGLLTLAGGAVVLVGIGLTVFSREAGDAGPDDETEATSADVPAE